MKKNDFIQTQQFLNLICYALGNFIAWLWLTMLYTTPATSADVMAMGGLIAMILITASHYLN